MSKEKDINKLLGLPYWDELDSHLDKKYNNQSKLFFRKPHKTTNKFRYFRILILELLSQDDRMINFFLTKKTNDFLELEYEALTKEEIKEQINLNLKEICDAFNHAIEENLKHKIYEKNNMEEVSKLFITINNLYFPPVHN